MAVFRVHKTIDFTTVSTHHLRNKELSLKAKGLLTIMLSLPEDWDYSVMGLAALSKDGKDAVMSTLNELSTAGYVNVESYRNDKGQYESVYNVYESPNRENRCGKSESDNPTQYNIINKDNNIPSVNDSKESITSPKGEVDELFEKFWNLYGKKSQRAQAERMWKRLTKADKDEVLSRVAAYVASTPDVQYRMNPATYLNPTNKRWLDEIIDRNAPKQQDDHVFRMFDEKPKEDHVWRV